MKKIRVWVVLLLTIVTVGIYGLVWFIKRRNEMVKNYQQKIPHWWWILAPTIVVIALSIVSSALDGQANFGDSVTTAAEIATYVVWALLGIATLVAAPVTVWWMWMFAKAASNVTNGKMPAGWTLALYLVSAIPVSLFLQYYFNRVGSSKQLAQKPKASPSGTFIGLAIGAMALTVVTAIVSFIIFIFLIIIQVDSEGARYQQTHLDTVNRLSFEYDRCYDSLERHFPQVTPQNEAAYEAAYNECEQILIEQNKAADAYNELYW